MPPAPAGRPAPVELLARLSSLTDALGRCSDLDQVLTVALDGAAELFGFHHCLLMMLDETGDRLFTIASRGYAEAGIGSEVRVGVGVIGLAAAQRRPVRVGNLQRMLAYARTAVASEDDGTERRIPLPGLPQAHSQLAAPAMVMGQLLGVLAAESARLGAFSAEDESLLAVVAHLVASAIELDRVGGRAVVGERVDTAGAGMHGVGRPAATSGHSSDASAASGPSSTPSRARVRFFAVDGSTFIDDEYLVKGVPGRILWRLLRDHVDEGRTEFTNREVRLDPSLELPPFRDNLESRLILLKRRLDERQAPMRIEKTGRGRFRLLVEARLELESEPTSSG